MEQRCGAMVQRILSLNTLTDTGFVHVYTLIREREREREKSRKKERKKERERERERERKKERERKRETNILSDMESRCFR